MWRVLGGGLGCLRRAGATVFWDGARGPDVHVGDDVEVMVDQPGKAHERRTFPNGPVMVTE
jgi:hypothetical protein